MALCSVKNTERERNTGFPSYFTPHSTRSTLSLIFSMSLSRSSSFSFSHPPLYPVCFGIHTDVWIWLAVSPGTVHKRLTRLICILHPRKKGNRKQWKASAGRQAVCMCKSESVCVHAACFFSFFFLFFGFGSLTGPSAVAVWCLKDVSRSCFRQASPPLTY